MSRVKIAFHGKMGSGKDTGVDFLIKKHGGTKLTFAKPLYDILYYAQEKCGFKHEKDRKFLQFIGTEWAREIDDNIWVNLALKKLDTLSGNVYNNDCRFINELIALKNKGFICVKIKRTKVNNNRAGTGDIFHKSEMGLSDDLFDFVIENNNSLDDFYTQIENIYTHCSNLSD